MINLINVNCKQQNLTYKVFMIIQKQCTVTQCLISVIVIKEMNFICMPRSLQATNFLPKQSSLYYIRYERSRIFMLLFSQHLFSFIYDRLSTKMKFFGQYNIRMM